MTEPSAATKPIRVFLLDDHEVVRRGPKDLLETDGDIEIVGESGLAQEATRRTLAKSAWIDSGSPTAGFLGHATKGPDNNPFMDDHPIYAVVLIALALAGAGHTLVSAGSGSGFRCQQDRPAQVSTVDVGAGIPRGSGGRCQASVIFFVRPIS